MTHHAPKSPELADLLRRMQAKDRDAREQVLAHFCQQLQRHAHKMLQGFPGLKRWVQTDDVFQNAMMRLLRALDDVCPESPEHFLRLASLQIRRELIDLARHHFGPEGRGAHHATNCPPCDTSKEGTPLYEQANMTTEPSRLAAWAEFHEQIQQLPEEERQVFDLLWYQELTQPQAAAILGLSERTLKRRWQSARLRLHEKMQGRLPEW
jgi:RNA polymerase sigma factor (sigma-70 family)